jgi:hypothetical protein
MAYLLLKAMLWSFKCRIDTDIGLNMLGHAELSVKVDIFSSYNMLNLYTLFELIDCSTICFLHT